MEATHHDIDPSGDVVLIIRDQSPEFAVWNETDHPILSYLDVENTDVMPMTKKRKKGQEEAKLSKDTISDYGIPYLDEETFPSDEAPYPLDSDHKHVKEQIAVEDGTVLLENGIPEDTETKLIEIRVSSKHLILASAQIKRMFNHDWMETQTLRSQGSLRMENDWDPDALQILMNIIHGRNRSVPKYISLDMLAKLAVLVDYYECLEAVEIYVDRWIPRLTDSLPSIYSRETVLWICISWVFRLQKEFRASTSAALKHCRGPIKTMALPIPERVIRDIEQRRRESIEQSATALHNVLLDFRKGLDLCANHCDYMLLGELIGDGDPDGFFSPRSLSPFSGFSLADTAKSLRSLQYPELYNKGGCSYRSYMQHSCNVKASIDPIVNSLVAHMDGLVLQDYM